MLLHKTDKARQELLPGVRTLSLRERSLLLLADGKPLAELQAMYHGAGAQIVDHLLSQGYLANAANAASDSITVPPEPSVEPAEPLAPSPHSLAGTRMYLFDLCERLFARRSPALARQFHAALRDARERDALIQVSQDLLREVGHQGGEERAQALRAQLAQWLPELGG